jgi:hypothetical protein
MYFIGLGKTPWSDGDKKKLRKANSPRNNGKKCEAHSLSLNKVEPDLRAGCFDFR